MNLSGLLLVMSIMLPFSLSARPDLLGPAFEPPENQVMEKNVILTTDKIVQLLQSMFLAGKTPYGSMTGNDTALSVQVVSLDSDKPLLDFHYTPDNLNISAGSITKVDAHSVYRVGSLSKLFTIYALLANDGQKYWDTPITKFLPELHGMTTKYRSVIEQSQWDEISIGALASQMGGISSDYGNGDLSVLPFPAESAGLPKLPMQDVPTCSGTNKQPPCSRSDFLKGYLKQHPVTLPYTMAAYANAGFRLLSYVVQAMTKSSFDQALQTSVFKPLGLTKSTTVRLKQRGVGVVPRGGLFSSVRDLSEFGLAILRNKQLSSVETRRWMKPHAHTASWSLSVGAPWEILRTLTGTTSGRSVDLYTKSGNIGLYSAILILVPDFNVVISVLSAGSDAPLAVTMATEAAIQEFLPVLEDMAKSQAGQKFAGTYTPINSTINSSLIIAVDNHMPGLLVKHWTSHGADVRLALSIFAQGLGRQLKGVRLYPMNLSTKDEAGEKRSYRVIMETLPQIYNHEIPRVTDVNAIEWTTLDTFKYGVVSIDDFVFYTNTQGRVINVEIRALRKTFYKHKD